MAYIVGGAVVLWAIGSWLFVTRAEMSEGKKALVAVGGAAVLVVILIALFGAFYESSF